MKRKYRDPQKDKIDKLISMAFPQDYEEDKPLIDSKSGRILAVTFCIFVFCLGLLLVVVSH
jgi:hypothetical protein